MTTLQRIRAQLQRTAGSRSERNWCCVNITAAACATQAENRPQ